MKFNGDLGRQHELEAPFFLSELLLAAASISV